MLSGRYQLVRSIFAETSQKIWALYNVALQDHAIPSMRNLMSIFHIALLSSLCMVAYVSVIMRNLLVAPRPGRYIMSQGPSHLNWAHPHLLS